LFQEFLLRNSGLLENSTKRSDREFAVEWNRAASVAFRHLLHYYMTPALPDFGKAQAFQSANRIFS
jgi:hypothetical protein